MGDQPLGRLIRRRRDTLGFSQARLGELVGRSASTIRNWERGKSTPSSRGDAVALAAVLGLEEHEVLESAGFDVGDNRSHQTVEQAYASLARPERASSDEPPEGKEPEVTVGASPERGPGADDPSESHDAHPDRRSRRLAAVPAVSARRRPETDERREVARAAPPTVLETATPDEPSYLEDPEERQRYRARALATAALVIFLIIVFIWSFDRAVDALGTMWNDFVGMLEI